MNIDKLLLVALAVLVVGCATSGPGRRVSEPGPVVQKVLATGRSLIGQHPDAKVVVNGRGFHLDCIGTVSAAWWGAGVDIQRNFRQYPGDGVNRLYESLKAWGALHWARTPSPGDLIIWDHTWDTGDDPRYPDGHTHAGIVLSVSSDGTVEYLHESTTRGVTVAYMNLYDPSIALTASGRVVNSPMYLGSGFGRKDNPAQWTSGQLWSAFGDADTVVRAVGL